MLKSTWARSHPRPLSRIDVHYGDAAAVLRVKEHQDKGAGRRSRAYEQDNEPMFAKGDIVRRRVAKSGKLDAAFSKRLYQVIMVKQYTKVKRPAGFQIAWTGDLSKPEPGLYRAAFLQRVALDDAREPVHNKAGSRGRRGAERPGEARASRAPADFQTAKIDLP